MSSTMQTISRCEVCGSTSLTLVLDLGSHPLCDDLVPIGDSRRCAEYPIEVLYCEKCFTAHQRVQVPKQELFPSTYHYRSRFTADVLQGMAGLVASCIARYGTLAGKRVLDVGCNDGSLLDVFAKEGAVTIGIEPTGAYVDAAEKGHAILHAFLSPEIADEIVAEHGRPDFITFTNVFAHIENLSEVLDSLKRMMGAETVIVIENHYLGAVLDGNQFDTFYHEHARTYSYTSFVHMARSLGVALQDVEFPSRYGGNIRAYLGNRVGKKVESSTDLAALAKRERGFLGKFAELRAGVERWRIEKRKSLAAQVRESGAIRAKAFPARAAILIKLLGLDESWVAAVYEKPGSLKVGNYVPGTRIPIVSDDELFAIENPSGPLVNLAWHIPREIRGYLVEHGYSGPVVDILSAGDLGEAG